MSKIFDQQIYLTSASLKHFCWQVDEELGLNYGCCNLPTI